MYADPAHHAEIINLRRIAAERTAVEPTTEQIKAFLEQESRTVQQQAQDERNDEVGAAWVSLHPEYKKTRHSAAMIDEFLSARGLAYTTANLDTAFAHLSGRGLIETNQVSVDGQVRTRVQDAELQRRAQFADQTRTNHTQEELEAMSLEELRCRAIGVPYDGRGDW